MLPLIARPNYNLLNLSSYVINSEAMKKIYKTMKDRPNDTNQPKDLGREWHSDSEPKQSKDLRLSS